MTIIDKPDTPFHIHAAASKAAARKPARQKMISALLRFAFVLLAVAGISGYGQSAAAGQGCYSQSEAEAEQGIRIHSELMVIGLNCQHMTPPGERNLYAQYRAFTSRYSDLIEGYEETLIRYFRKNGHPNPVASLNLLRTAYANDISGDAARMRPDLFCRRYIQRISAAGAMNRSELRQWASTIHASHPLSKPLCRR